MFRGTIGLLLLVLPVHACKVCLPRPESSITDHLVEAEVVVLARADPVRASVPRPVEILRGDPGNAPIDIQLNKAEQSLLAADPARMVICVYRTAGPFKGWKRVGLTDRRFGPLVREIVNRAAAWKDNPNERVEFFVPYLEHADHQIRTLAHTELARAPYQEIKRLGGILPREKLRSYLLNRSRAYWHALYILLLAQSDDERDREYIRESLRSAARTGSTSQLAAWATANLEIDEGKALEFIEAQYFRDPARRPDELNALLLALSVHGTRGHTHLRDGIVDSYRIILKNYPAAAPQLVDDLVNWECWELAEAVSEAIDLASFDRPTLLKLRSYLGKATEEPGPELPAFQPPGNNLLLPIVLAVLVLGSVGLTFLSRARSRKKAAARG